MPAPSSAMSSASAPRSLDRVPLRRVAIPVVAGWALLSVAALAAHEPAGVARAAVAAALVLAALAAARQWRLVRTTMAVALATYAVLLVAWTVAAGLAPTRADDAIRVALFTGNPNDLGAALVAAGAAWMGVTSRWRWWAWLWPALAVAVIYTGSRTSGGALVAAFALWLLLRVSWARARSVAALGVTVLVLVGVGLAWQYGVVQRTPNLLGAPNDLAGHDWRHHLADSVEVIDGAGPGPFDGTTAQRLVARAREDGRALLLQSVGRSELGVPYVASLYLRADTPQEIVLSSHLAGTTCEVGSAWRRCVTPVAYGDDHLQAQFYLRATEPGGRVDVLAYGAQYEVGLSATPFRGGRPDWIPQSIVRRFDLRRLTPLPEDRVAIWRAGLAVARDHPWFGVGLPTSETLLVERTRDVVPPGVTYAHNLLVHLLLVHGLVGLVGAAAIGGALVVAAGRGGWRRIAPLLVALALLNTWDLTLFEPEVASPVVVALALVAAGRSRLAEVDAASASSPPRR